MPHSRALKGAFVPLMVALLFLGTAVSPRASTVSGATIVVPLAGSATWTDILANAGVIPPLPSAPVTTGGFDAVADTGFVPPDSHGAAGPNHLVTMINGGVRIQTKTGRNLGQVTQDQFFYRIPVSTNTFDPKIFYDATDGRWIASTEADARSASARQILAVSATSDPTGLWYFWSIDVDAADANWADHTRLGFNRTWITMTANVVANVGGNVGNMLWVVDKATALAGGSITVNTFGPGFDSAIPGGAAFTLTPAVTVGNEPTLYIAATYFLNGTSVQLSQITGTGPSPVWSVVPGSVLPGSGGYVVANAWAPASTPGAAQAGSASTLETFDDRMQDVYFRDGRLWFAHVGGLPTVSPTRTATFWSEVDPTAMPAPEVQSGVLDTGVAGGAIFEPSIAPNASRDAVCGFTRSDSTRFAEAAFTSRLVTDLPGTMGAVTVARAGLAKYVKLDGNGRNRWGDWSATCIDPCDDATFWTIQEYAAAPLSGVDQWATYWQRVSNRAPPTITCPGAQTLEATGPLGRSVTLSFTVGAPGATPLTLTLLDGAGIAGTATVPAGGPPTSGTPSITANFSVGVHNLTAVVSDCSGATTTCTTTLTIEDTTAPTVSAALKRTILWTARNALESVGLTSSATDLVNGAPAFVSTTVFSDEGHLTTLPGPDGSLTGVGPAATLRLRSQRKTNPAGLPAADGRVYLIVVRWTDGTNVGFTAKSVICPLSMTATKLASANAQAAAAVAFALANAGAAPAGFSAIVP